MAFISRIDTHGNHVCDGVTSGTCRELQPVTSSKAISALLISRIL